MKKNLAIVLFAVLALFMINSAMADSNDCPTASGPIYTDTGMSGR